jgi:DNA-binding XRE family transcriptional regulator
MMTSAKLKAFRDKHDLTQHELAKLLKVKTQTISNWECKRYAIPYHFELAIQTVERNLIEAAGASDGKK